MFSSNDLGPANLYLPLVFVPESLPGGSGSSGIRRYRPGEGCLKPRFRRKRVGIDREGVEDVRPPRRLRPGALQFITIRCLRGEFRLRPDPKRTELFGFWLARALQACPGIELIAVVQMSNHLHIVLRDKDSSTSRFMCRFLAPLGSNLNQLDGTEGPVFAGPYANSEILDEGALFDRILYTVTNPVKAGLVRHIEDWPGLLMFPGGKSNASFSRRVIRDGEIQIESCSIQLGEVPELEGHIGTLRAAIDARCEAYRFDPQGLEKPVVGAQRVMDQPVFRRAKRPDPTPNPRCHASSAAERTEFMRGWKSFVQAYREASAAFRRGILDVVFPPHCFRPWIGPDAIAVGSLGQPP